MGIQDVHHAVREDLADLASAAPTFEGHQAAAGQPKLRQLTFSILAVLAAIAILLQLKTYPNHDVAWVLWGTREMLMGAKWGVNIIEPNPPLAWYLSIPTTIIAMWSGLPLDWIFRIAVVAAGALSVEYFCRLLPGEPTRVRYAMLCATAATSLLILPGKEFGQREHLVAIGILPYLALCGQRICAKCETGAAKAAAIGVYAAFGLALKPYFLVAPLCLELAIQIARKRKISLIRPENLAICGVGLIYAAELFLFEQDYLQQVVPLASSIYWSFDRPLAEVWDNVQPQILSVLPFVLIVFVKRDRIGIVFLAALVGFIASYFVQHKGYQYHLFPFSVVALLLLAHLASELRGLVRIPILIALIAYLGICALPTVRWWKDNRPGGPSALEVDRMRNSIAEHALNGRFLVVSLHPYPTFPVAIYTGAHHVSRTNSHWFLGATAQLRAGLAIRPDAAMIEKHAREFMLHDLSQMPDLVLIDTDAARHTMGPRDFDYLAFFKEDPAFQEAWRQYREIEPIGKFRQFVRIDTRVRTKEAQVS
ncbi:hypothetical protein LZ518_09665 [Sphingomonas sp. RB56-2]|uniref:Glycosyltransferase RgtA/B/C/D-like domain-containing protein n=1 Tax=Sphingomonas brevis TaxID=2908206 RepID=A0ABT0SBF9_9SPHN|nr:hypothetical protein [Sphingomonas brevis]MCL6741396.1 hypothetical protein [Sphingomonas brevis]